MKRIGLALSGGFASGLAHIGVIKVLEENNIPIYCVAGTSMGSVVGALYAAGFKARKLESLTREMEYGDLFDFVLPKKGLVDGKKIEDFISNLIGNKRFKDLKKPFAAVATNLTTGKIKVFNSGSVARAVRASISYPVIFTPIKIGKSIYVDGGLIDPFPVDVVAKMGCNKIIGSDVSRQESGPSKKKSRRHLDDKESFFSEIKDTFIDMELDSFNSYVKERKIKLPFLLRWLLKPARIKRFMENKKFNAPAIFKIMMDSIYIMGHELRRLALENKNIDVVIRPKLENVNLVSFDKINYLIEEGEKATRKLLPQIKKLLR